MGAHGSIYQTFSPANRIMLSQYYKTGNLNDIWVNTTSGTILAVGAVSSSSTSLITHDQILRSSNGGINWTVISPSPTSTAEFYNIKMVDANTGFICGSKSAVYKTINGGVNWDSVVIPNMPQNLILSKVDFVNAQTGWIFSKYLTGTDTTIFKTTNGGVNWLKQKLGTATGSQNTINAACMLDENNGWLLNGKPRPWKTTNGGASWDSTALGDNYLAGALYDIKMLNALTGYCVGSNNRVYKTTNGGATPWSNVSFSSTTVITLYALEVLNPLECVVMGTYGTAFYTSNGGSSWQNLNLGSSIDDIKGAYLTSDRKIYAVTLLNSCIFKNSNIFSVGIGNQNQENPSEYKLMQNYPNPFNPETTIKFTLPKISVVSLIIYDVSGREVKRLIDNVTMSAGTATQTFSGNNLSSGIYFCSLMVNGKNLSSMKMIILK